MLRVYRYDAGRLVPADIAAGNLPTPPSRELARHPGADRPQRRPADKKATKEARTREDPGPDVVALNDQATFLSQKVNFLLDATLGRINLQQNQIIKIFCPNVGSKYMHDAIRAS